jgi:hypothetical protein
VLLQGFLKVWLLISGSIMLYLVVDAERIFSAHSDRIGKEAVVAFLGVAGSWTTMRLLSDD